mmetsp:Transcript_15673/g.45262  ORF Transcript_15673/g.45262 Transcript_15673/m.45262 type:complete len:649 (+) Transcript_15673:183-2129(+)
MSSGRRKKKGKRQAVNDVDIHIAAVVDIADLERQRRNEATALTKELFDAIEYKPIEKVREAIGELLKKGHRADGAVKLRMKNEKEEIISPIIKWAHDRYDTDKKYYTNLHEKKPFFFDLLRDKNEVEDASDTLRMLLQAGANPRAKLESSNQTVLHLCMIQGNIASEYKRFARACVSALLEQVTFTFDHLAIKDASGESALHCALSHSNFECANLLLFSEKVDTKEVLNNLKDSQGDNILASLVRYTDLPYDNLNKISDGNISSPSFVLFTEIVHYLQEVKDYGPLRSKNKSGENVFAVAAKCGCFHELNLLASIKYEVRWTVSNVCTHADEVGAGNVRSPLELAKKTLEMVEEGRSVQDFEEVGICGTEDYLKVPQKKKSWSYTLKRCIKLLEQIEAPLLCSMEDVRRLRSRSSDRSVVLTSGQTLSSKAEELRREMLTSSDDERPDLKFEHEVWKNILGSKQAAIFRDIRERLRDPYPGPYDTLAVKSFRPVMIRDPKDPCHRASISLTAHFGLFATQRIPRHTIICEYAGEVRREDEGGYNPVPEYSVKLERCDSHILSKKNATAYDYGYMVDGELVLNEGSVINDARSSLVGEEDTEHRDANASFMEVIANGWPHIFVIATTTIEEDEEILIDYGPEYWEKNFQ